jgi:hypothetical protein
MVTETGTVAAELFEEIPTAAPPVGAGPERLTVQTLGLPPATVAGTQPIEDRETADDEMVIEVETVTPPD